jgi:hypothetical protein
VTADTATAYTWRHEQGELDKRRFPVLLNGAAFDASGWSVDAKIKTGPGGSTLHTWVVGDIAVSGLGVDLTILPATSLAWTTWRRGWFRLKIIHPSDATQIHRIAQGPFLLSRD